MEHGRKDEPSRSPRGALFALGRMTGFLLLVLPAIAALAALVLVPAYADMLQSRYLLECDRADIADLKARVTAQGRLIADLPESEVQTKRLMLAQTLLVPENEIVRETPLSASLPPAAVRFVPAPRPAPPNEQVLGLSRKLADKSTRRGVFLVAVGAIVTAMFLFSAPDKYRRARTDVKE